MKSLPRRDGKELFYRNKNQLWVVALKDGATFEWDPPRAMFTDGFLTFGGPGNVHYDVAPDRRFLMIEEAAPGSPTINVVQGWPSLPQ